MKATVGKNRLAEAIAAPLSGDRADPFLVGVFAFVVSVLGASRPSLWLDEAATISGSTRTLPQMWAMVAHVDGVHGLYYLLMHAWFTIVPATEFWARVPSALLVGASAAGVVVLGARLSTRSVAIAAGVVVAVLPRTTWAGIEARPYALSIFCAVWLTVLCAVAVRRDRMWIWAAYSVGLALAAVGNVFVSFVVAAHAVVVVGTGRTRRPVGGWAVAVVAATIAVAPFLQVVKGQRSQVAWIWPVGPGTLGQFLGDQYFPAVYSSSVRATGLDTAQPVTSEQVWAAIHAWALVLPLIIVVALVAVGAARMRRCAGSVPGDNPRLLAWTAAVWILVPTAVLVGYSAIGEPMYQPQYLSYTVPGLALLIGLCVVTVGREPHRIAIILTVVTAAAVPNYLAQRGPYAKFGQDYSEVADLIAIEASPGDCLNVDTTAPSPVVEGLKGGRPESFAKLRDLGQDRSGLGRELLFESRVPVTAWADKLRTCSVLWTVTERDLRLPAHARGQRLAPGSQLEPLVAYQVPTGLGFQVVERWQFNLTQVVKSVQPTI